MANRIIEYEFERTAEKRTTEEICREMKDPNYTYTCTPDDAVMIFVSYTNDFLFCIDSMTDDVHDYRQAMERLNESQKAKLRECLETIHDAEKTIADYIQ